MSPESTLIRKGASGRLFLTGVVIVLLGLAVVLSMLLDAAAPAEPSYNGVRLSKWLNGSMVVQSSAGSIADARAMSQVLRSVGPEALPWLVSNVEQSSHLFWSDRLYVWCLQHQKIRLVRKWLPHFHVSRRQTAQFNSVGLLARLAPGTTYEPNAARAVINTHQGILHGFDKTRLYALSCFTNAPKQVIPVLVTELTNPVNVDLTIAALQNFHSVATPYLYPVALKETGMIRPAEVALEKADPVSYQRLCKEKERSGQR